VDVPQGSPPAGLRPEMPVYPFVRQ
jgi:hypothetical protein